MQWRWNRTHWRIRNPLPTSLMRSSLVEVQGICREEAGELLLLKDQEVIQAFSPDAAQEAFTHSISSWGSVGVRRTLMPLVIATRAKCGPNLRSLSRIRYFGPSPYGVASRSCCATHRSVGERVTFTWITLRDCNSTMKKAKSGRKKRSVTCRKSQAHISAAWLRRNVFQVCPLSRLWRMGLIYF